MCLVIQLSAKLQYGFAPPNVRSRSTNLQDAIELSDMRSHVDCLLALALDTLMDHSLLINIPPIVDNTPNNISSLL
eukprot:277156-Amphidinium_carterae.1